MSETTDTIHQQDYNIPSEQQILNEAPMKTWRAPFKNSIWLTGFIFLLVSAGIFSLDLVSGNPNAGWLSSNNTPVFVLNFLITLVYGVILISQKQLTWIFLAKPEHYATYYIYLSLWLISCFALNREIPIFNESCNWLSWHICLTVATLAAYAWKDAFSRTARLIWYGAMAWSTVMMLYFTIYLAPVTFFSSIVVWFFLIPFHAHIPLIISITLIRTLSIGWQNKIQRFAIIAGLSLPIAITIGFANSWRLRDNEIREAFSAATTDSAGLPRWVIASQRLSRSAMGESWLKSSVLFEEGQFRGFDDWGNSNNGKKHNPLIWIASGLFPMPEIAYEERQKILRSFFDKRHDAHDRLWMGSDLTTVGIETAIEIDPAQRFAYTEKTVTISNSNERPGSQEEAFYTFYLPEGAAVSALSLWINGEESKARLSARSTADSAYKTIVGRERRDPSLVHWQEGSTVTVRVFPCTPEENRQFKIGVTSPLREEGEELVADNIVFQGPPVAKTKEAFFVKLLGNEAAFVSKPGFLKKNGDTAFEGKSTYDPSISFRLKKPIVAPAAFAFNGKQYLASAWTPVASAFAPSTIYLDINAGWEVDEIEQAIKMAGNIPVQVSYKGAFATLSGMNGITIGKLLRRDQFSMFPFHRLPDPQTALVITKSKGVTPLLEDLRDSPFAQEAKKKFGTANQPIRVWHIGDDLTPYLRSLREFRLLLVFTGDWDMLGKLISARQFYENPENEQTVVIPNSGLRITRQDTVVEGLAKGSDHLLRLFAYNDIMRKTGSNYFSARYEPAPLVREAEEAFIVTPVSSLVVLEKQEDYKRFGIDENKNTLGNAAMSGKGSVPEPGEWALLLLLTLSVWWVWRQKTIR